MNASVVAGGGGGPAGLTVTLLADEVPDAPPLSNATAVSA